MVKAQCGGNPGLYWTKMNDIFDNSQWPLNSYLVSQTHKVLYLPIAKNATTTLKRMFVRLSGHPDAEEILSQNIHRYLVSHKTGISLCDYTPDEAASFLNDPDCFSFTVLRSPLERVVSSYIEKIVSTPSSHEGVLDVVMPVIDWVYAQRGQQPDYQRSISFEEFVNYLLNHEDRDLDTHFKSQESFFAKQKINFFGTIEKMSELTKVLEPRFGQKIKLEWTNRTKRRKSLIRRRGQADLLPAQLRAQRTMPHASELLYGKIADRLSQRFAQDIRFWQDALESGSPQASNRG